MLVLRYADMLLSLVCNTSRLHGSESELLDTAYVASARMHTTISRCSASISTGRMWWASSTQWLTLTVAITFVDKSTLPLKVILCLQLPYE